MDDTLKDIAVVGDREFCLGFRLAGVTTTFKTDDTDFEDQLDTALEKELGIIIVDSNDLNTLDRKKRMDVNNSVDPVVVALSTEGESSDLRAKIKKAIGVDIWS